MNIFHNKIIQAGVLLISLGLCLNSARTIIDLWQRKDLVLKRQQDLTIITRENEQLLKKLKETQGDDYVERIARDKLGMVKDGETIVLLEQGAHLETKQNGDELLSNWQKWRKLFF